MGFIFMLLQEVRKGCRRITSGKLGRWVSPDGGGLDVGDEGRAGREMPAAPDIDFLPPGPPFSIMAIPDLDTQKT
jgi:hypothetical protein